MEIDGDLNPEPLGLACGLVVSTLEIIKYKNTKIPKAEEKERRRTDSTVAVLKVLITCVCF